MNMHRAFSPILIALTLILVATVTLPGAASAHRTVTFYEYWQTLEVLDLVSGGKV